MAEPDKDRNRSPLTNEDYRIDWASIRDMVRAPAYYRKAAISTELFVSTTRGETLDERAERLQSKRSDGTHPGKAALCAGEA